MSTHPLSLKDLERKVVRSTYQDGLLDIYQGGLILSATAFAGVLQNSEALTTWQRLFIFLAGAGLSSLIFWGGKKFITLPRLGQVKFGPARLRRKRTLIAVLGAIVAVQAAIVALTIGLWQIPGPGSGLGLPALPPNMETLLVAVIGVLFVGPAMTLLAYFSDFSRGYYIAAVLSTAVFCLIWFDNALLLAVGGALVVIPGLVLFVRFLIQHPLPPREIHNG